MSGGRGKLREYSFNSSAQRVKRNSVKKPANPSNQLNPKAFNAIWLEDSLNDIYDSLPEDKTIYEISLFYESNKVNMIAVKTAVG